MKSIKVLIYLFIVCSFIFATVFSTECPYGPHPTTFFKNNYIGKYQSVKDELKTFITNYLNDPRWKSSGVSLAVTYMGDTIFEHNAGRKNDAGEVPTKDTIYRIASVTKVFTSLLLFKFVDEGIIKSIDDPISDYIHSTTGQLKFKDSKYSSKMTFKQLSTYLSGLPRDIPCEFHNCHFTNSEMFQKLKDHTPLIRDGNTQPHYSNLGFSLLAEMLSEAYYKKYNQAKPYPTLIKEKILTPLQMSNSGFTITTNVTNQMATPYKYGEKGNKPSKDGGWTNGSGFLYSTLSDLIKFVKNLQKENTGSISISEKNRKLFLRPSFLTQDQSAFGHSWEMKYDKNVWIYEKAGDIEGFNSYIAIIPNYNLGFVVLCNGASMAGQIFEELWKKTLVFFQKELRFYEGKYFNENASNLKDYTGIFNGAGMNFTVTYDINSESLKLGLMGEVLNMKYRGNDMFQTEEYDSKSSSNCLKKIFDYLDGDYLVYVNNKNAIQLPNIPGMSAVSFNKIGTTNDKHYQNNTFAGTDPNPNFKTKCYLPKDILNIDPSKIPSEIQTTINSISSTIDTTFNNINGGAYTVVMQDGNVLLEKGNGFISKENNLPPTKNNYFRVGSITKTVVAATVMKAVQEKKLNLDDPITNFFNITLKNRGNKKSSLTFRQVASHLSGLQGGIDCSDSGKCDFNDDQMKNDIKNKVDLLYNSYENGIYSNIGIALLGHSVKKAYGYTDFLQFFKDHMLNKIGMKNTEFTPPSDITKLVRSYNLQGQNNSFTNLNWNNPAGGFFTTPEDITNYMKELIHNNKVLNSSTIRELLLPVHGMNDGSYGLGLTWEYYQSSESLWYPCKSGSIDGYRAFICLYPPTKTGIFSVVSDAQKNPKEMVKDSMNKLIGSLSSYTEKNLVVKKPSVPKQFLGKYRGIVKVTGLEFDIDIVEENNNMVFHLFKKGVIDIKYNIEHLQNQEFKLKNVANTIQGMKCSLYFGFAFEGEHLLFETMKDNEYQKLSLPNIQYNTFFQRVPSPASCLMYSFTLIASIFMIYLFIN